MIGKNKFFGDLATAEAAFCVLLLLFHHQSPSEASSFRHWSSVCRLLNNAVMHDSLKP